MQNAAINPSFAQRKYWELTRYLSTRKHRLAARCRSMLQAPELRRRINADLRSGASRIVAIALTEHNGDIIAAEPIVRHLKQADPDIRIYWIVSKRYVAALNLLANIDRIVQVGCYTEWIYLSRLKLFPRTLDLHVLPRSCTHCELIQKASSFQTGDISQQNFAHHGSLLSAQSRLADLDIQDESPRINIPLAAISAVEALLTRPFIVIHAEPREKVRAWPVAHWARLIDLLTAAWDGNIVELGLNPILSGVQHPRVINRCGMHSLAQTAAIIERASLFIGIDSALAHIANATSVPAVILMAKYAGFTDRRPYSGRYATGELLTIVSSQGQMKEIEPTDVARACLMKLGAGTPDLAETGQIRPRKL